MSGRTRIDEGQRRRMYDAVVHGVPVRDVAARFGVSERTVRLHVRAEAERRMADGGGRRG